MVEKTPERKICLIPVQRRSKITLEEFLLRYVDTESTIHPDCWKAYEDRWILYDKHLTVNHSEGFKDPITGVLTNTIK